jgi:hypothetical protein
MIPPPPTSAQTTATVENLGPPLLAAHLTAAIAAPLHPPISIQSHKLPQIFWRIGTRLVRAFPLWKNRF